VYSFLFIIFAFDRFLMPLLNGQNQTFTKWQ